MNVNNSEILTKTLEETDYLFELFKDSVTVKYLENHEHILNDGMYVKFDKIADDGYNLRTACFTDIIPYADYLTLMDEINFKIMSILNKHKASLAYKSQTIYFRDDNKK